MSERARYSLFATAAAGLAALLGWGIAGLPAFGDFHGRFGLLLDRVAVGQRHATNVVAAVVFDYRGFDTLGEEFILFASVLGVALLLREARDEDIGRPLDPTPSEPLRALGPAAIGITALAGLYVVAHGYLTPGGGFQGGVLLAASATLLYVAGTYRGFRSAAPTPILDLAEGGSAGAYALVGVATLAAGSSFLANELPLGKAGTLASAGTLPILNAAVALAVAAAFVLLFTEFLEEFVAEREDVP